ncbi:MAG TPA: SufE family protein [Cytophagaceae bacterium]|jgi:cysteine desulfuration protein SufE|nr:SufE family protein [Cytophagaceae bacterium]
MIGENPSMETKSIKDTEDMIVEEFSFFDEWDEKYSYIIDLGKMLAPLDEKYRTEANKIKGCQSQVWLNSYLDGSQVIFEADSDATIVKGLTSLMVRVLSGHTPEEILNTELGFIERIGMTQHLSPTRSNGLASMVKQMKLHALAYKSKLEKEERP